MAAAEQGRALARSRLGHVITTHDSLRLIWEIQTLNKRLSQNDGMFFKLIYVLLELPIQTNEGADNDNADKGNADDYDADDKNAYQNTQLHHALFKLQSLSQPKLQ